MSLDSYLMSGGTASFSGYNNAVMDALLQQGNKELDTAKRQGIYDKVQEHWEKDLPVLGLYSEHPLGAVSKKVKVAEPDGPRMFINVHEWDIEN